MFHGFTNTVITISIALISVTARAEESPSVGSRFGVLSFFPAFVFSSIGMHEGSHALGAAMAGARDIRVFPRPGMNVGRQYMGMTSFLPPCDISPAQMTMINLAPYISDIVLFAGFDLLLTYHPTLRGSSLGVLCYIAGMVAPFVDMTWNFVRVTDSGSDFRRAADAAGGGPGAHIAIYLAGMVILSVALWRVIQTGIRVFSSRSSSPYFRTNRRRSQ